MAEYRKVRPDVSGKILFDLPIQLNLAILFKKHPAHSTEQYTFFVVRYRQKKNYFILSEPFTEVIPHKNVLTKTCQNVPNSFHIKIFEAKNVRTTMRSSSEQTRSFLLLKNSLLNMSLINYLPKVSFIISMILMLSLATSSLYTLKHGSHIS